MNTYISWLGYKYNSLSNYDNLYIRLPWCLISKNYLLNYSIEQIVVIYYISIWLIIMGHTQYTCLTQ